MLGLGAPWYSTDRFAAFRLPAADRDFVEVFGADHPRAELHAGGLVVGVLVDDVEEGARELAEAGVELIGSVERSSSLDGYAWIYFRGPDASVYALVEGSRALPE